MSENRKIKFVEVGREKYESAYKTSDKKTVDTSLNIPNWNSILTSNVDKKNLYQTLPTFKFSELLHVLLSFKSQCHEYNCNPSEAAPGFDTCIFKMVGFQESTDVDNQLSIKNRDDWLILLSLNAKKMDVLQHFLHKR